MQFVDTNILLYAVSGDSQDEEKSAVAEALLEGTDLALSVQVLQEFYTQATRSTRIHRLSHDAANGLIELWLRFPVQEITVGILRAALKSSQRFRISYWDASIIEAARAIDCPIVLSEDLSDDQDYAGVRVVNPFARKRPKGAKPRRK